MFKERYDGQRKFSRDQKREMAEYQEYMCGRCGRSFWRQPLGTVQAHHISLFSKGGATVVENGVLLCPACHKDTDNEAIYGGQVWPGNYTEQDIQPEQKRSGWFNRSR